ncbi:hypothetical protein DXG01_007191 [Tephrocybe rancida]|nr:hypothetical protein DXG01_007191 [Tephrocybe rancida]
MPTALVIGASRGLGFELAKALQADGYQTFGTTRSDDAELPPNVNRINPVDIAKEDAGAKIAVALGETKLDLIIVNAGIFMKETFDAPSFEDEVEMYKVVSIAPVFLAHHLYRTGLLASPSKFILITTEGGSITLRTKEEGGGNYGHHGSKAAANMVGKLANDFYDKGITPGFMKTDMTRGVGFDQYYESAVEPAVAARSTIDFISTLTHEQTGTFWAPRGPRDIGEAERVLRKNLPTPLQLLW